MNFTPKIHVHSVVLIIAVVGLIGWTLHVTPAPIVATPDTVNQEFFQTSDHTPVLSAIGITPVPGLQTAKPDYYQPVTAKKKHWFKRNAPILGGAGGGALVGGLIGGGTGAVIGGAAGAGGGYLYKRHKNHHHNNDYYYKRH
jgi:uncharacterized protein YcfJ